MSTPHPYYFDTTTLTVLRWHVWHSSRRAFHPNNSYVRTSFNMNHRHLSLRCQCGEIPDRIAEVGFTDEHSMVIHWWCTNCKKVVYVTKSLRDRKSVVEEK